MSQTCHCKSIWSTMSTFLLSLAIFSTLVLGLSASDRARDLDSLLRDENEIEFDKLEMLRRLWRELSEGGKYSDKNEAYAWIDEYDSTLQQMSTETALAGWNYATNITSVTAQRRDNVTLGWLDWAQDATEVATKFYHYRKAFESDPDLVRKLKIASRCGSRPSPDDARLTQVQTRMETIYSNASVTNDGQTLKLDPGLTQIMETSRDYEELKRIWGAWRDESGKRMKDLYEESVNLQNKALEGSGFKDLGQQWRSCNFEEPEQKTEDNKNLFVEEMVEDLLEQIDPLYKELHAYVRYKLRENYSEQKDVSWFEDDDSPIPAHLLGNMWSQEWMILDLVEPFPGAQDIDVTNNMKRDGWTVNRMFRTAESFFTSLGLPPMTDTFWEKSMFERPADGREVVCHASAEDFSQDDDFRIKMCAEIKQPDLQTVHHEMGHIEYFMLYSHQPQVYRQGANSAFHEAIGDTIALSVMTPAHLKKLDLLPQHEPSASEDKWNNYLKRDINFLMKMALGKVAFLPFGYLVDKWRWDVFSGKITKSEYNKRWWKYRLQYQGIAPPITRSEEDFDPGAKYHVASAVPYIRYFLSFIGQFQFHKALCEAKHHTGDLYTCDIHDSKDAGKHLRDTLELGSSVPWPQAMKKLTGQEKFDASAISAYFRPLMKYLKEFRKDHGYRLGWKDSSDVLDQFFES